MILKSGAFHTAALVSLVAILQGCELKFPTTTNIRSAPGAAEKVIPRPPLNLAYGSSVATYTKGVAISNNTPTSSGGEIAAYVVDPALPSGLFLDPLTGVISGTPQVLAPAGVYVVTGSNKDGATSVVVNITINDAAPTALTYTMTAATYTKGVAITANAPMNMGGVATNFIVTPVLPTGLSINVNTGAISGTPLVLTGAVNYTVTAMNSGGSTSATLNIRVVDVAPAGLAYAPNPATYTKGSPVFVSPTSNGGPVVSYAVNPSLPAGMALNGTTGAVNGAPTAIQNAANYVITATNTGGSTSFTWSIKVNDAAPTALAYSNNPVTYTQGVMISTNSASNIGGAVVSYSVSPALPAGLSLNAVSGAVTGTPTAVAAQRAYTVTATNTGGSTTADLLLAVNAPAPAPSPTPTPSPSSSAPSGGAPIISSVTGTVASGQIMTINGASMIQENKANWDPMFQNNSTSSFEGASLVADGYTTSGCPTYTTAVKLMGNKSVNMHDQGQHIRKADGSGLGSCNWQWPVQASMPGSTWTDVFLRTYSRWTNTSWATIDTKYWWISGGTNYAFFNMISKADGSAPTEFGVYTSGVGNWSNGTIPGGAVKNDRWYLMEAHFRMQGF